MFLSFDTLAISVTVSFVLLFNDLTTSEQFLQQGRLLLLFLTISALFNTSPDAGRTCNARLSEAILPLLVEVHLGH